MKTITIYEIIEAAEKKYIDLWDKSRLDELVAEFTDALKSLIAKGKQFGYDISIEDAVICAIKIFPKEINRPCTQTERDMVIISAFKMACEKGGPFSENLIKMISVNFLDILVSLKEKAKE